jgi:hypothetical protein
MIELLRTIKNSIIVGLTIALCADFFRDQMFFNNISTYIFSIAIAVLTGILIELVYKRIFIRKNVPSFKKYLSVYGVTVAVYTLSNLIFLGTDMILAMEFYMYMIIILILITPMIIVLNRRMMTYNSYLQDKQKLTRS